VRITASCQRSSSPCRFLEGIIARLTFQLATLLRETDCKLASTPAAAALEASGLSPLPAWLTDASTLNPLLAAYDRRVETLDDALAARRKELATFKVQVEEVVAENESLADKLDEAMALVKAQVSTSVRIVAWGSNLRAMRQ
jgi:hypothetical protein